jgi:hypothetical protein
MKHTAQTLPSARLVKVLGADARIPSNDEEIDRGPLPEVSESDWVAFDLARDAGKGERLAQDNDRRALEAQVMDLDAMRRAGWI